MSDVIKVEMKKKIKATRAKVFSGWSDPNILKQWFAPGALMIPSISVDFKVNGTFSVSMIGEMGGNQVQGAIFGTYKKIIPNELLVFTFTGNFQGPADPETMVTVEFKDIDGGTEITLIHEHMKNDPKVEGRRRGWESSLDKLSDFFI